MYVGLYCEVLFGEGLYVDILKVKNEGFDGVIEFCLECVFELCFFLCGVYNWIDGCGVWVCI